MTQGNVYIVCGQHRPQGEHGRDDHDVRRRRASNPGDGGPATSALLRAPDGWPWTGMATST